MRLCFKPTLIMYSNLMKSSFQALIILLIASYSLQAQLLNQVIQLDISTLQNEFGVAVDSTQIFNQITEIKSNNWDLINYNPFKEEKVAYPFKITFEDSLFAPPISKDMVVTSRYGWRWRRNHSGIDIDLIKGDNVHTLFTGIVRYARYKYRNGNLVVVRHLNGLETAYSHLSKILVKPNDTVYAGDILGKGGATGNARGSHLHLTINYKGIYIHPEYVLDFDNLKVRSQELWVTKRWTTPYFYSSRRKPDLELLTTEEEAEASLTRERKVYIVKKGDTLSRISVRSGVPIHAICELNRIRHNSILRIGQRLVIEP